MAQGSRCIVSKAPGIIDQRVEGVEDDLLVVDEAGSDIWVGGDRSGIGGVRSGRRG